MARQSEKGGLEVMDTGILDLPDSEEEADADAGRNPDAAGGASGGTGGGSEAATGLQKGPAEGPPPAVTHPPKESTVSLNPTEATKKDSFSNPGSVAGISKKMKKTRIVSFAEGGGGDDVFGYAHSGTSAFAQSPDGFSGSNYANTQDESHETSFPPIYNILRAAKQKKLLATRLASPFGFLRVHEKRIGYGAGGLTVLGDDRGHMAQNFHCGVKGLNISFSLMRPDSAPRDELTCLACPDAHSFAAQMRDSGCPVAIMASDQNFPPLLPASNGKCIIVVRVEDGLLGEIESALTDRFKAYNRPHGTLPPGSVICIGSLSHLRARGLADYAEATVSTASSLRAKFGNTVEILPLPPIPLHGVDAQSIVRGIMDFDAWLAAGRQPPGSTLSATRTVFWQAVRAEGGCNYGEDKTVCTYVLPTDLRNSRKVPVTSEGFLHPIPISIPPLSVQAEKTIIGALIQELNDEYGLGLCPEPDHNRILDPDTVHDAGKTVYVGASHMRRVTQAMGAAGGCHLNLCAAGWTPTKENLLAAAERVSELRLGGGIRLFWTFGLIPHSWGLTTWASQKSRKKVMLMVSSMSSAHSRRPPLPCLSGSSRIRYRFWMRQTWQK